ncbi:hypothetical protein TanjilG_06766 [Lupinus angustifolius]|uniref:Root meristem growth factor 8 n=1 Tax=Lupinus angustifolius TaxID=3871 RepID=A0A1J7GWE2_LUPAN|nr:PREDICTED: uncharacterized protein LOC109355717 [Lupinus angustifolius]OIW04700.1 hypothetical protein TanjilG_06766 [Lupinus angustifolius]
MRLISIITLLSIFFSALLPPSTSLHIQFQPSLQHQEAVSGNNYMQQLSLPALPRKLRFTDKVQEYAEVRDLASHKQNDYLPAVKHYRRIQNMMVGNKKSKQEWMEGDNSSEYFTMDYHNVRKRPPIHN